MKKFELKKTSKKMLIGCGLMALVSFGFVAKGLFLSESTTKQLYEIYEITEMDPLKLEGKVNFIDTKDIFFDPSLGKISEVHVKNGVEVKQNTPLITYNNPEATAAVTEQENTVNRTALQVQQAQESINIATQKYNDIVSTLTKTKNRLNAVTDVEEKISINNEVEQLNEAASAANVEVLQAKQSYELANNDALSAKNILEETKKKTNFVVISPIDGRVSVDLNSINNSEKPIIKISTQKKNIKGKITEYDYDKLVIGQEVTVTTNGSGKTAQGKIASISQSPLAADSNNVVSSYEFDVEGEFPWVEGLSASISVPQKKMIIPESAVVKDNKKEIVYLYKDGKVKKTIVDTEIDSGRKVVKKGLNWKEKIILNPNKELTDNQEIQVNNND